VCLIHGVYGGSLGDGCLDLLTQRYWPSGRIDRGPGAWEPVPAAEEAHGRWQEARQQSSEGARKRARELWLLVLRRGPGGGGEERFLSVGEPWWLVMELVCVCVGVW
jgi:hypothetical protein